MITAIIEKYRQPLISPPGEEQGSDGSSPSQQSHHGGASRYSVITVIVDAQHRLILPVKEEEDTFETLMVQAAEYWSLRKEDYHFEFLPPSTTSPVVLMKHQPVAEIMRILSPKQDWRIYLRMYASLRHEVEILLNNRDEPSLLLTAYVPDDKRNSQDVVGARRRVVDAEARRIRLRYKRYAYAFDFGVRLAVMIFTVVALSIYYPGNTINTVAQLIEKRFSWPTSTFPTLQSYLDARFPFVVSGSSSSVVSPVRLRQLRVLCDAGVCPAYSSSRASTLPFNGGDNPPDNQTFTFTPSSLGPSFVATSVSALSDSSMLVSDYDDRGGFYLFPNMNASRFLVPGGWIDNATRVVMIEFNRYDPSSNLYAAIKVVAQFPPWLPPATPLPDPIVLVRADGPPAHSPDGMNRAVAVSVLFALSIFASLALLMSEISVFRVFPLRDADLAQLGFSSRAGKSIGLLNAALTYKQMVAASMPSLLGGAPAAVGGGGGGGGGGEAGERWQLASILVDISTCAVMIAAVAMVGQAALDEDSRESLEAARQAGNNNYTEIYGVVRGEGQILALVGTAAWLSVISFAVRGVTLAAPGMALVKAARGSAGGLTLLLALAYFPPGFSFAIGGTTMFSAAATPAFRTLTDAVYAVVTTKFIEDFASRGAEASDWVLFGATSRVFTAALMAWLFVVNLFAICVVVVVVEGVMRVEQAKMREERRRRAAEADDAGGRTMHERAAASVSPSFSSSLFFKAATARSFVVSSFRGGARGAEDETDRRRAEIVSSRRLRAAEDLRASRDGNADPTNGVANDWEGWSDGEEDE